MQTVSQHLAVLRDARLVSASVEGRHRRYHLTASPLREIADWLAYYERFWDDAIDRLGTHLEETRRGE
jgi:DNA-binding transcriptional ArsR family regulator